VTFPAITDDQRMMVTTMLANALRKDAHLRERAHATRDGLDVFHSTLAHRRADPSQRYIDGMCDLLRVMFVNGDALVRECLEDAYVQAMGLPREVPPAV
jgi:hypothetical protein